MMFGSGRILEDELVLPGTRVKVADGSHLDGELATVKKADDRGMVWVHYDRTGEMAKKPGDRYGEMLADSWIPKTKLRRLR